MIWDAERGRWVTRKRPPRSYAFRKLPPEPLNRALRRYALARVATSQPSDQGLRELARLYADRFGGEVCSHERFLHRLNKPGRMVGVREDHADQWLTLIGSHLDLVYPELVLEELFPELERKPVPANQQWEEPV